MIASEGFDPTLTSCSAPRMLSNGDRCRARRERNGRYARDDSAAADSHGWRRGRNGSIQNQQAGEQLATGFHRSSSPQPTVSAGLMQQGLHHEGRFPNLREPEKGFA
jgi:hypothetical protein